MTVSSVDAGMRFAGEMVDAERTLLHFGWHDPPGLREAAASAGLSELHFQIRENWLIFEYLHACAASGTAPSINDAVRMTTQSLLSGEDLREIAKGYQTSFDDNTTLASLAADVVSNSNAVRRWRELEKEQTELLDKPPTDRMKPDAPRLWQSIDDVMKAPAYARGLRTVSTGYVCLDDALGGGFRAQCMTTIAARTGFGKSTLAGNLLRHMGLNGVCVLFFKLEESPQEAVWRIHAAAAQVPFKVLSDARTDAEHAADLQDGASLIRELPIRISSARALDDIVRASREHKQTGGQIIIIDQLSHIQVPDAALGYESATIASNTLRRLAVELDIPMVLIAQVNRGAAKSSEPLTCSDLRDSGAIENDSAVVMFINNVRKPEGVVYQGSEPFGYLDIIIAKNRYGQRVFADNPLVLHWWPRCCRIEEPERRAVVPF